MNSNNSFNNSTYPFGIIGNFHKGKSGIWGGLMSENF